jgi:hypothetical protein
VILLALAIAAADPLAGRLDPESAVKKSEQAIGRTLGTVYFLAKSSTFAS